MNVGRPRFEVHKAQKIAAAMLLFFLVQALWLLAHLPLTMAETRNALAGQALWSSTRLLNARSPMIPGDSILTLRCAGLLPSITHRWQTSKEFSIYAAPSRWLVRLPFLGFGLWLGAALWWVARRIFGDEGGYVSLGLYCFSPPMLLASATADSAILAAWGVFGLIFTAIGVAHTLYAPRQKWRPRILLLGLAIGLTAAASLPASVAGLLLGAAFMLYLAPGRRCASLVILTIASAVGAVILLACFGFSLRDLTAAGLTPTPEYLKLTTRHFATLLQIPGGMLALTAFAAGCAVFVVWKRTRYFGNAAPLIVALLLPWWPGRFLNAASEIWMLPFAFVFIGGVYADLLEERFFAGRLRKHVAATAYLLVGAAAALSVVVVTGS